ncbi:peptidoglycan-binding domain-containing protein [Leptothoe sp. PORK10 BA2]|uniref:peptidoglycan-binding domain-containing protein n=1 Tax=Leptothoe sp. PORK10 BA2 TaxID=3110254 RepID=UPI002B214E2D|nr:peptidoglycan-binding domain-containing protein [Leptothoe sp. PORK10 BA2]MEA5467192.1 peptidoglycan-binding domain-containing protein [Leptothoe sp. PORK10 BA2]
MESFVDYKEQSKQAQHEMLWNATTLKQVREYCAIASQRRLSEQDADRLAEIIRLAEADSCLELWINEADHFLDHELGLRIGRTIHPIETESQKTDLLEHLNFWTQKSEDTETSDEAAELLEEIHEFLTSGNRNVQENLKKHGFDPGPIDGVVGPRTQEAILRFQRAHNLYETGTLDSETRFALGYR